MQAMAPDSAAAPADCSIADARESSVAGPGCGRRKPRAERGLRWIWNDAPRPVSFHSNVTHRGLRHWRISQGRPAFAAR